MAVLTRNAATGLFPCTVSMPRGSCPCPPMVPGVQAAMNSPQVLYLSPGLVPLEKENTLHLPLSFEFSLPLESQAEVLWPSMPLFL